MDQPSSTPYISDPLTSVRPTRAVLAHPAKLAAGSEELSTKAKELGIDPEYVTAMLAALAEQPRPVIVSDVPALQDRLGFGPTIRTLANIVLSSNTDTPLTIAVDGEWGSGKTSVLKMVERQARMLGFSCIWLNAWR